MNVRGHMNVRAALQQGQQLLENAGVGAPQLTAEVLLIHAISLELPCNRAWLYAHAGDELRELWWIHYGRYLHQRMEGKPTQYITGVQEFYGRAFHVTPDVLIPRPETEHLVEAALAGANAAHPVAAKPSRILDIGTGSGAIAVTLALETTAQVFAAAHVFATDISRAALNVAAENACKFGAQVTFAECDLGSAFANESFDMIASNPPYVPLKDRATMQREVRDHEPEIALFAGENGLAIYRRLIPEARRLLKPGGRLIMELGHDSVGPVRELLGGWEDIEISNDLAGIPRVAAARKPMDK